MKILLLLNFTFSFLLILSKTPLSKGFILLLLTMVTSLSTSTMYLNSWFGYILFLIMIGGLLVAFIYMTSVASNEKFNFPNIYNIALMTMLMLGLMSVSILAMKYTNISLANSVAMLTSQEFMNPMNSICMSKIFSNPMNLVPIALMSYLLLTLIMVVKMTEFSKGPIRQK